MPIKEKEMNALFMCFPPHDPTFGNIMYSIMLDVSRFYIVRRVCVEVLVYKSHCHSNDRQQQVRVCTQHN